MDGKAWKEYLFKYKPGPLDRSPPIVAPYQPRLDWQMWFAALGPANSARNQWLLSFIRSLLAGSREVLELLDFDPFAGTTPRYIRASLYEYSMSDINTLCQTGRWWRREYRGEYLPALQLAGGKLILKSSARTGRSVE